jgi:cytoskeletal protein RodZ
MSTFGEELRKERERRGLSLTRMSEQTKVNPRYLEALERGDFHQLPGGVFRRGIFRSYVETLGLLESEWLPRFQASIAEHTRAHGAGEISGDEAWSKFALNVKRNRIRQNRSQSLRWLGVALLSVALAASAWTLWILEIRGTQR